MKKNTSELSATVGKWMMYLAWIIGLMMAYYFFQNWIEFKKNPNQNLSSNNQQPVVLAQNARGHYVATGSINGIKVQFLLDTGATDVVIPEALADKLNLTRGTAAQVVTANGIITVYPTTLNSLTLGGLTARNISGVINPYMDQATVLLGMSFLKNLSLVQYQGTLTLSSQLLKQRP